MTVEIVIRHGDNSSLSGEMERIAKDVVRLGRSSDNDVRFDFEEDRLVSGHHAEVYYENGQLYVRDLESRNGVYVNGLRIVDPEAIGNSDKIELGENGPALFAECRDQATEGPARPAGEPPKRYIGEQTLVRVVEGAVFKERSRNYRTLAVVVGALLVVVFSGFAFYYRSSRHVIEQTDLLKRQAEKTTKNVESLEAKFNETMATLQGQINDEIKSGLAKNDQLIKSLGEKLTKGEEEHARLIANISERQAAMQDIVNRSDLSDKQRNALIEVYGKEVSDLRAELKKNSEAMRQSTESTSWPKLVDSYQHSVFLCAAVDPNKSPRPGIGTAFAISADGTLATNAHVVDLLNDMPERFVVQNGTGRRFNILEMKAHKNADAFLAPDVGLIKIDLEGETLRPMPLAENDDLKQLRIGIHLGTLGFPGELLEHYFDGFDEETKRYKTTGATFKDGWVGRITNYNFEPADFDDSTIIQHSASLSGGTSGSPMFSIDGKVLAVNFDIRRISYDVTKHEGGKAHRVRATAPDPSEIAYAIRVDVLKQFIENEGW